MQFFYTMYDYYRHFILFACIHYNQATSCIMLKNIFRIFLNLIFKTICTSTIFRFILFHTTYNIHFASYTYLIDLIVSLHVERVKHDLTLHSIIHEKDVLAVDINMEYILDVSIWKSSIHRTRREIYNRMYNSWTSKQI